MSVPRDRTALECLRAAVETRFGLDYPDDRLEQLAAVIEARMASSGERDFEAYAQRLVSLPRGSDELAQLAEELTVTETFFFRSEEHLLALTEVVVPELRARGRRRLSVLCAGCASGEEPYSIAMSLREAVPDIAAWDVQILGIDVNRAMLARARAGRYSAWSLRATEERLKQRYFKAQGREFVLERSVAELVRFEEKNLSEDEVMFWEGLRCDAVFCRNVLMYFAPSVVRRIIARFERVLDPSGFLFLGHAETLRGVSNAYHLCHTHEAFYYRRASNDELVARASTALPREAEPSAITDEIDAAASWVDAIRHASRRIEVLLSGRGSAAAHRAIGPSGRGSAAAQGPVKRHEANPAPGAPRQVPVEVAAARDDAIDLAQALTLVRQERFVEALALLRESPPETEANADKLLLLAVVLTNQGARAEAEATCARLLALDELHAGAHYLMALCREHAADAAGAVEHDQTAIYLDSGFAMPHLHLGLLAKRGGDHALARRELSQALNLLEREDAGRVLLFGGGFSREALSRVCRAELASVGAPP